MMVSNGITILASSLSTDLWIHCSLCKISTQVLLGNKQVCDKSDKQLSLVFGCLGDDNEHQILIGQFQIALNS